MLCPNFTFFMNEIAPFFSETLAPVALAALLGSILGIERDLSARPAGFRTSALIAMGACIFTYISYTHFQGGDPSRIASQVVTGVGFLGAGVLLKGDQSIHGLTTAANIWIVAAVGMSVGVGAYDLAVGVTVITVIFLSVLRPFSRKLDEIGYERAKLRNDNIIKED